jgi:hypothetical protein
MQQNVGPAFPPDPIKIAFEVDLVPTDGTRLPIVRSGDFGASSLFGQLSGKHCA